MENGKWKMENGENEKEIFRKEFIYKINYK